jgi:hypothetical protein
MKPKQFICFRFNNGEVEYLESYVPNVSYSFTAHKESAMIMSSSLKQQLKQELFMGLKCYELVTPKVEVVENES